ncbi:MAG: hypothetical protein GEU82_18650 [Luteitalea sp.]|nr:hypothetical protein [Luteitalea sp.]
MNLLGVHLGAHQAISGAGEDNPRGHWEHNPLALLNDEILNRFGGRWDEPPAFPPSWPRDPRLADLREKARQILAADFATEPLWGWKDPRTCLTIPFWQDLIGSLRYVMCVRNPCAVVASLGRRNGMSSVNAERLWLTHVQSSLAHTSGQPRMFVFYEDVIDDWALALRRLAAFIGRPEQGEDPRVHASVSEFLEKDLCHHRMSMEDLAGDRRISFATKGLYVALRGHARRAAPVNEAFELDRASRSVQKALDLIGIGALETWDRTVAVAAERDTLARENLTQAAVIAALRDEQRRRADAGILGEKATALSEMRSVIAERDVQAREHDAALRALQEIHASSAWRLVTLSRRLIVGFLPAGTRRRRVFNAVLRRIAQRADAGLRTA